MLLWCVLHQKALLPRSSKLLPIFPGGRSPFFLNFLVLGPLGYSSPNISRDMPQWIFFFFFFFFFCCYSTCYSTYSLYQEDWIIQEPVCVLHLITCHRHIMPCLAELLFYSAVLLHWSQPLKFFISFQTCSEKMWFAADRQVLLVITAELSVFFLQCIYFYWGN